MRALLPKVLFELVIIRKERVALLAAVYARQHNNFSLA